MYRFSIDIATCATTIFTQQDLTMWRQVTQLLHILDVFVVFFFVALKLNVKIAALDR